MENASFAKVRIETSPFNEKKGLVGLTATFIGGLFACLVVGLALGPPVFDRAHQDMGSQSLNVTWFGFVDGMEPWHQVLYLDMRLKKPRQGALTYEQQYVVSSWGAQDTIDEGLCPNGCVDCNVGGQCNALSTEVHADRTITCDAKSEWCSRTTLLTQDFVQYGAYYMKVFMQEPDLFKTMTSFDLEFEIVYITRAFTRFQMAWFYSWATIVLLVMFMPGVGYFSGMRQLHQNFWSRQQVRVGVLLVLLLLFDNIFFAFQILSSAPRLFFSLYVLFVATFLANMLFFWLELFSDLASGNMQGSDPAVKFERNRKKALKEYLPKVLLVGLIWITTVVIFVYVRVKQTGDPSYDAHADLSSYGAFKVLAVILATTYFLWLLHHVTVSLRQIKYVGPEYRVLLWITLATIAGTAAGLYSMTLTPRASEQGATSFTLFTGMMNIYVLILAYCYTPVVDDVGYGDINVASAEMVPTAELDIDHQA